MSSNLLMPIDAGKCKTCGKPIPVDKKYCSKECYYKRFTPSPPIKDSVSLLPEGISDTGEYTFVGDTVEDENLNLDLEDPVINQLKEEHIIMDEDNIDPEHWCPICGARKILGRCVRFTQHEAPKKPKSR